VGALASETQRITLNGKPSGGLLVLRFNLDESVVVPINSTMTTAASVGMVLTGALRQYFNGSVGVTVTSSDTTGPVGYVFVITFSTGVPQLTATTTGLVPSSVTATITTLADSPTTYPACEQVAAAVLACHNATYPDFMSEWDSPRSVCCNNASMLIPACGNSPEGVFTQWGRLSNNWDVNASSILMSYMGACPRFRPELPRPAVTQDQCLAMVEAVSACGQQALASLTPDVAAMMTVRDRLATVSSRCCSLVTGVKYACLGRDLDALMQPTPMAMFWTLPASQPFYLSTYAMIGMGALYNSATMTGMDPGASGFLRNFLAGAGIVDLYSAMFVDISVNVDSAGMAHFGIVFPESWGGGRSMGSAPPTINLVDPMTRMPAGTANATMREFGWSPSAVLLRFLLNGQADQLYLQLSGMTSGGMYPGYYPTTSTPSFPDLVCPAFTPNFCAAAAQLTYSCQTAAIANMWGATTPTCVDLAGMIDNLCQGYPWRTMLGSGNITLSPTPATMSNAVRGILRLAELNQHGRARCNWSVEGLKVTPSGSVYSDRCPAANGVPCMSTDPNSARMEFGVPYYPVGPISSMPGYAPVSPECGINN